VQQLGWIILAAVIAGPVLMGLLLHRLGFSRAVSIGLGSTIVGAALLVSREPLIDSSTERALPSLSDAGSPSGQSRSTAPDAERAALFAATQELRELRRQLNTLEAERRAPAPGGTGDATAKLEREIAAHSETRLALKAMADKLEASAETQRQLATELQTARPERASVKELEDTRRRLAIAEATIARLEAATRAAPLSSAAAPLPLAPAPFSAKPPEPPPSAPAVPAEAIVTGTANPSSVPDAGNASTMGRALSEASKSRRFELTRIEDGELVEGRRGSYYRITCPDGTAGRPLRFEEGGYSIDGGQQALATCLDAIRQLILSPLPPSAEPRLYVRGFARTDGFQKPKRLDPRDARLKSITYLPKKSGTARFVARGKRQSLGDKYASAELPNLRAAYVADWITKSTRSTIRPEILEGALKSSSDPSSRSFDLVLQTVW